MAYSNSPLISGKVDFGAKKSNPRKNKTYNPSGKISKITVHHMAGKMDPTACANMHLNGSKNSSANYYIGNDGKIILGVPEERRAWTSSSPANDYLAVTIEVANSLKSEYWPVSDAAYKSLIELCTDICVRNGIAKLNFTGDKNGNLTMHKYFAKTACPGPYLEERFPDIARKVNDNLSAGQIGVSPEPEAKYYIVKKGDTLSKIGVMYGIRLAKIKELNPDIKDLNKIYIGQKVRIK